MHHRFPPNPRRPNSTPPLSAALGLLLGLIAVSCGGTASESSGSNGTGGDTGGSGTSTAGAGGTTTLTKLCEDPVMIPQADGSESGFVKCKDGSIDREKSVACQLVPTTDTCDPNAGYSGNCKTGADCTAHPNGTCQADPVGPVGPPTCSCQYQCQSDADCDAGEVCGCGREGTWPQCIGATSCKLNTDCASGECGLSFYTNGCTNKVNLACRTAEDECRIPEECFPTGSVCSELMASGHWSCSSPDCTI